MVEPMSTTDTPASRRPALRVVHPASEPAEAGILQHMTLGSFDFELGGHLDNVTLAYRTWGRLNASGDNAVIILHALTGDSLAGGEDGWWTPLIGPGKPIDTG